VLSDTHVPDQVEGLHPGLLAELKAAGVQLILHAGDICSSNIVDQLGRVAPVAAVQGNRDPLFSRTRFPLIQIFELAGINVCLTHGYISWRHYFLEKFRYLHQGYKPESYLPALEKLCPQAEIIVFGHTHHSAIIRRGSRMFFNPGSGISNRRLHILPTYGLLHFINGQVIGTIIPLKGAILQGRKWKIEKTISKPPNGEPDLQT
jgi:hypothetical protein